MPIEAKLKFLQEIDQLKKIERKTLLHSGGRYENSAEHSWHLAMAVLVFHSQLNEPGLNLLKALQMALLHDIVEIDAGDVIIYGDNSQKMEKELLAAQRIFGLLPDTNQESFHQLWNEFEEKKTMEAKFVGALDRFLPIYSNYLNGGHSWKEHNISYEQVIAKNKPPIMAGFPELWAFVEVMLEETTQKGSLRKGT